MIKEVKIELTEQCKRWCTHCSSKAKDVHFHFLDIHLVKRIIDEAVLLKSESVVFTGGEATLYSKLEEAVSYAHNQNLQTKLYTMCDPNSESIEKIKNLRICGLDEMIYSTTYHLTRDAVVSLEKLNIFFPELLSKADIKLGFHHAITSETLYDIEDIISLFFSLPASKTTNLSFLRFVPHGRGNKELLLNKEQLLWFKEKMIQYKRKYNDKIRLGSPWNFLGIEYTPCTAAEKTMIVGFDGSVYPCDAMKYFDYLGSGGNIKEHSLEEIYYSKYFHDVRNSKNCLGEECFVCENRSLCMGGCLGQKMVDFVETKSLSFEHYGKLAKRTMRQFENNNIKRMNGEMGIIGEIGELVDSFKKYKTHDLNPQSKQRLLQNLEEEIGDIVWYLAASLSSSYAFEFEDIGILLFDKRGLSSKIPITDQLILESAKRKDPECLKEKKKKEILVSYLD